MVRSRRIKLSSLARTRGCVYASHSPELPTCPPSPQDKLRLARLGRSLTRSRVQQALRRPDGFAEFAATFANPARHDAGSFRIDHNVNAAASLRGRYSFAGSEATQRGANGFSLNTTNRIRTRTQSVTGSWMQTLSPTVVFEIDANYSRARVNGAYLLDTFGGATVPVFDIPQSGSFAFDLNSRNAGFMIGDDTRNTQRQINLTCDYLGFR